MDEEFGENKADDNDVAFYIKTLRRIFSNLRLR